jgi:rod shape-determining protein MreC
MATISAIAILYATGGVVQAVRSIANVAVSPFSFVVNSVARPFGHLVAGAINYSDVVAQNQRLRYELGQAQLQANESWGLTRQLSEIQQQLNVPFVGTIPTVAAQVTTLSPTNFAATFDINRGRDQGVLVGMPVVANGGLVGQVVATTPRGATVRLISDIESLIGTTYDPTQPSVLVSGGGLNNGLTATGVTLQTTLKPGQILSTDGLSGALYPPGIPVATVKSLALTPGAATYNLTLQPTADLRHLAYVDVMLWEPSN